MEHRFPQLNQQFMSLFLREVPNLTFKDLKLKLLLKR
jgi:hypothetical protein